MSSSALRRLLLALVAAACTGSAAAALTWEKKVVELDVPSGAAEAVAVFPFRNAGTAPIRIAMVLSSCDCVTAQPAKDIYGAGESGELRAVFKPGSRTGRMERIISIVTDDAPEAPVSLILRIEVKPAPAAG